MPTFDDDFQPENFAKRFPTLAGITWPSDLKQLPIDQLEVLAEEIRQMIVGRYRVLFTIRKHKVHVLHVRGAHVRGD